MNEENPNDNLEPSEELIALLKDRLKQHRENPGAAKKWTNLKSELLKKYTINIS
ncbi:MAG: hypothetical protein KDK36_07390 [Leptospiraceae bacterium]|nr:hypothetical protein [Leptospiraceae bacterium]